MTGRTISELPPTPAVIASVSPATTPTSFFQRYKKALLLTAAVGLLLAVAASAVLLWPRQSAITAAPQSKLWRATFEAGLQSEPTWSPDGGFLAFSSDQAGNFDIWARPAGEGDAVQVTKSPAHDWQPDWSPADGTIVFRTERDGGGLYVIPALGGAERRISNFGYHPRWSPDGSQILFLDTINVDISERRRIFVVALDGKAPREVLADATHEFAYFSGLTWHPDGKRVSVWATHRQQGVGLWTLSLSGGAPVVSIRSASVKEQFAKAGVAVAFNPTTALQWSPSGKTLYFEGVALGVRNLWQVEVDPDTLQWIDGPQRLTISPGADHNIRISRDGKKLAFTARTESRRLWSLSISANAGVVTGEAQPVTPVGNDAYHFDLARDGKKLAYFVAQGGREDLHERSLVDNVDKLFTSVPGVGRGWPRWSRDGQQLSYRHIRRENNRSEYAIGILSAENNESKIVTAFANRALYLMTDWTADNQSLLGSMKREPHEHSMIALFPLSAAPNIETQARVLAENPEYNLWSPRFSPNEQWIVFNAIKVGGGAPSTLYVIPAAGGDWVQLTDGTMWSDKPRWSPDGKTIYFISNRAGFFNVWGLKFDPQAGQPVGEPFRLTTLESPSRMLTTQISGMQIGVSADRLIVPVMEVSGNVWVLENFER